MSTAIEAPDVHELREPRWRGRWMTDWRPEDPAFWNGGRRPRRPP